MEHFNNQNSRIKYITESTLVVGIDVGSTTHFARAFDWRKVEISSKAFKFSNTVDGFEAFDSWLTEMKNKGGKERVIVGMEPTGHYWFNLNDHLNKKGIDGVLVNPYHVKSSKELDDCNPSKNDRKDPKIIAGLVVDGRYTIPYVPVESFAEIRNFSNQEASNLQRLVAVKNKFQRAMTIYFPNYKSAFKDCSAQGLLLVLKEAPLPEDIVNLGVDGVNGIWRKAKLRGVGVKRAKELVEAAKNTLSYSHGHESAREEIRALIDDLALLQAREKKLMGMLEEKVLKVDYAKRLLAIRGVGMKTVIGFIAEVGDITRFKDPREIQKYAGLAVVNNESGKHKGQSHISRRGRHRLRYTLYEAAVSVVGKNEAFAEIHTYYTTREKNPLKKMQSLIAVACKLIRVFYAIAVKGVEYDEQKLLDDIQRREVA